MYLIRARGKALDDVRVSGRRAAEAAHVVAIHQVELALLSAGKGQRGARDQQYPGGAEVNVAVLQVGEVVGREPACDGEAGATASKFQEALTAIDGVAPVRSGAHRAVG